MTDLEEVSEVPPVPTIEELQDKLVSWQNYALTLQRILQILTNEGLAQKFAALQAMDEREKVIVLFKPALGLALTLDDCYVEEKNEEDSKDDF